ncbi:MAG: relaxase/mobilization nuclease domain-containing protein [Alphaproteobacteria bacterium]|nr:relaxase/mobilization nuclease domain-containing protein [Alphaproteobacteria bacterium]
MIIKSHIRGGFRDAAAYLKAQGENEKVRLVEMSDPHVKNLDEAFKAMWAVADGTKVKKPLHHVSINPMKEECLTDLQVSRICERLEEQYGYTHGQHQRVIVEHIKDGRQHFHVIWNRVNMFTGKPHYPYMHKKQSKIVAREMERELGLKKPISKRGRAANGSYHRRITNPARAVAKAGGSKHHIAPNQPTRPLGYWPGIKISLPTGTTTHQSIQPQLTTRQSTGGKPSGMCEQQWLDFVAACEGKITWKQYFQKWGGNSHSSGGPEL